MIQPNKANNLACNITLVICALLMVCSIAFVSGCANTDKKKIQGEWKTTRSEYEITVVFTDTQFKTTAGDMYYELHAGGKMTLSSDDGKEGSAEYTFNDSYSTLTIVQTGDDGKSETTEFQKVSDDTAAQPSAAKK